jgi:hypothetical protein
MSHEIGEKSVTSWKDSKDVRKTLQKSKTLKMQSTFCLEMRTLKSPVQRPVQPSLQPSLQHPLQHPLQHLLQLSAQHPVLSQAMLHSRLKTFPFGTKLKQRIQISEFVNSLWAVIPGPSSLSLWTVIPGLSFPTLWAVIPGPSSPSLWAVIPSPSSPFLWDVIPGPLTGRVGDSQSQDKEGGDLCQDSETLPKFRIKVNMFQHTDRWISLYHKMYQK